MIAMGAWDESKHPRRGDGEFTGGPDANQGPDEIAENFPEQGEGQGDPAQPATGDQDVAATEGEHKKHGLLRSLRGKVRRTIPYSPMSRGSWPLPWQPSWQRMSPAMVPKHDVSSRVRIGGT